MTLHRRSSRYGDLVFRDADTDELLASYTLVACDTRQEVLSEVHSLQWRGEPVHLDIDPVRYEGTGEYTRPTS